MKKSTYQSYKGSRQPTPGDIEGPFFKEGAPTRLNLTYYPTLTVEVNVLDTEGHAVSGATVDFWQANEKGEYDNEGYDFRGQWLTGGEPFILQTVMPGCYDISEPSDPQPHEFRCAHLHFKIRMQGYKTLTTQLYFPDDRYNETDHWFDPRRVIQYPVGRFDFVIEKD